MAVAAVILCSCGGKSVAPMQQAPPPAYATIVVQPEDVTLETSYPVNIKGQVDVEVRPRIDGFIQHIYINEGSVVRKGQSLFKIDSPSAVQGVVAAESGVTSAQAALNTAKINVDRMRPLADKGIISITQLQTYENQFASAQASYNSALATLRQAQAVLSWTNVLSPVDGIAGSIPFREGNLVNSANVLTTVADTRNVYAYFSISEKELMALSNNFEGKNLQQKAANMPPVSLTLADGSVYPEKGRIEAIAGVVNTTTGAATLRASFPNKEGLLKSGSSGRIAVPRVLPGVFRIPQKATVSLQDKVFAYKVLGDSIARAMITVESTPDGQSYAVTGGLTEGDRIVAEGLASIRPGMKITPQ